MQYVFFGTDMLSWNVVLLQFSKQVWSAWKGWGMNSFPYFKMTHGDQLVTRNHPSWNMALSAGFCFFHLLSIRRFVSMWNCMENSHFPSASTPTLEFPNQPLEASCAAAQTSAMIFPLKHTFSGAKKHSRILPLFHRICLNMANVQTITHH